MEESIVVSSRTLPIYPVDMNLRFVSYSILILFLPLQQHRKKAEEGYQEHVLTSHLALNTVQNGHQSHGMSHRHEQQRPWAAACLKF